MNPSDREFKRKKDNKSFETICNGHHGEIAISKSFYQVFEFAGATLSGAIKTTRNQMRRLDINAMSFFQKKSVRNRQSAEDCLMYVTLSGCLV